MKRSDRLLHIGFKCLRIGYSRPHRADHFAIRAGRLFHAAQQVRVAEGGAA